MNTMILKPGRGYLRKTWLIYTIIAFAIAGFGLALGLLIGIDEGPQVAMNVFSGFLAAALLFWIPSMALSVPYYKSLSYEIQDDEVIVRVGIVTKSVKHVPYRTVTNITVNRGLFDRFLFNLGTLNIQTAGMSGSTGAEESLVGLTDVQGVYDIVVEKLHRFRGGMSPTTADDESGHTVMPGNLLGEILDELREIRKNTDNRS
ncbi:MAG: PH domain-containing protein [Candidatus Krumholzibacteria bacterium]|nr:PH domain-containing protein [Candidatus Krumholzibacteria bacterium]